MLDCMSFSWCLGFAEKCGCDISLFSHTKLVLSIDCGISPQVCVWEMGWVGWGAKCTHALRIIVSNQGKPGEGIKP